MGKRSHRESLVRWIIFLGGFTLGLGVAYWSKVEPLNIFFYASLILMGLGGIGLFGFELWLGLRAYRQSLARTLENSTKLHATRVQLPALPKLEILELGADFVHSVETSISQDGS